MDPVSNKALTVAFPIFKLQFGRTDSRFPADNRNEKQVSKHEGRNPFFTVLPSIRFPTHNSRRTQETSYNHHSPHILVAPGILRSLLQRSENNAETLAWLFQVQNSVGTRLFST